MAETKLLQVNLAKDDYEEIVTKAKEQRLAVSSYVRMVLCGERV